MNGVKLMIRRSVFSYMFEGLVLNSIEIKFLVLREAGSWFVEVFDFNNAKLITKRKGDQKY